MPSTRHLALPYIMGSQAQKHVTHNEALRMLDVLVQLSVADAARTAPPAAPEQGDRHIVGPGAADAWSGRDGQIAAWQDGAWAYFQPEDGWVAWIAADQGLSVFRDGQWRPVGGASGDTDMLGINATADAVNRLAVSAEAVLLSHSGAGHQLKINKAAPVRTASLLFQTGFSGRAEMGTTGDDDFRFKVSADGETWTEAIVIDRVTGAVAFPNTQIQGGRERLGADRTYHVRMDGSDDNDGLADTPGGAFASIQHAMNTVYGKIDLGPYNVTIRLGDGVYAQSIAVLSPHVGSGIVTLAGNAGNPASTVVSGGNGSRTISLANGAALTIRDFELRGNGQAATHVRGGATLTVTSGMRFGAAVTAQLYAQDGGIITAIGESYVVTGSSGRHLLAVNGALINALNCTVTLIGTPHFSSAYAQADRTSVVNANGSSFSGAATGPRYNVATNGVINTSGGGPTFLPGSALGSVATGGVYA